jgi:DNA repair photolyase
MIVPTDVKTVLNKHKKRDSWFLDEYSVNPYQGCSVNCLYCYIRGSKYGENMEEKLAYKKNLLPLLEKALQREASKGRYGFVALGTATDAYMPVEEKLFLTQQCLQLILKYQFPLFISTKSLLIKRDFDVLKEIDRRAILPADLRANLNHGVILSVSLSTLNERIAGILEPGSANPASRLELLAEFKSQGFLAGVNAIPLLPFISDTEEELDKIILGSASHGADFLLAGSLCLFGNGNADSRTLYYKFLEKTHSELIPQYDKLYGLGQFPPKYYQQQLSEKAAELCKKYGIRNRILA